MPSSQTLVLMYHGLSGRHAAPESADPHYTLPTVRFCAQLDALTAAGFGVGCLRDRERPETSRDVVLTFDDGDLSNYTEAFPALLERGLSADFFVNPERVGRPGFCTWLQLREMADAGMSIQSHGMTHTYFTHLDRRALTDELRRSKSAIEEQIAQPVTLLAPPGGRCPRGLAALAQAQGYRTVLGSVPGVAMPPFADGRILPRVALTAAHDVASVLHWAQGGAAALRGLRTRYAALALAKRLFGDRGYERLREALLSRRASVTP
ncbi:MAG: polysaccharide deacetylase family protein [Rhodanobacteraceae bacterium]|nr:polysaccharide deacetylase family protein [Rhodanobacteraceae bacterium]